MDSYMGISGSSAINVDYCIGTVGNEGHMFTIVIIHTDRMTMGNHFNSPEYFSLETKVFLLHSLSRFHHIFVIKTKLLPLALHSIVARNLGLHLD
jgi:hypothetical protein